MKTIEKIIVAFLYWRATHPDKWQRLWLYVTPIVLFVLVTTGVALSFIFMPEAAMRLAVLAIVVTGLVWALKWED